jgi:hypothetical protein
MPTIKISELNLLSEIDFTDFVVIVDSGSLTTLKTTIETVSDWIETYVTSSVAKTASLALYNHTASLSSYANSASYLSYESYNGSASYSITSSNTVSASYMDLSETDTGGLTDYAITASYALISPSASYKANASAAYSVSSISSSNTISSSYAISASSVVSSSYAITSSNSFTSSYSRNIPVIATNVIQRFVKNLTIQPTTLFLGLSLTVIISEILLWDGISKYIKLQNINVDAPLTPTSYDKWYDLYLIYNETTQTVGVVYSTEMDSPNSSLSSIASYLPSGFTYYKMIGSSYPILYTDTHAFIERYMEYGNKTKFNYRTAMNSGYTRNSIPTSYLISVDSIPHHLGHYPDKYNLKFIKWNNSITADGWRQGDVIVHDSYSCFTQIYMERANNGYENFPAYLISSASPNTMNIKHTQLESYQNTYIFNANGGYDRSTKLWSTIAVEWVALVTLESNGHSV